MRKFSVAPITGAEDGNLGDRSTTPTSKRQARRAAAALARRTERRRTMTTIPAPADPLPMQITLGDKYGPAMRLETQKDADAYFERLVAHCMAHGSPRDDAERIERENLGYFAAYYGDETRARIERLFRCEHPILGAIATTGPVQPEAALEAGKALRSSTAENARWRALVEDVHGALHAIMTARGVGASTLVEALTEVERATAAALESGPPVTPAEAEKRSADIRKGLEELVALGHAEKSIGADGEPQYRLTSEGRNEAEALIRRHGLDPETLRPAS